MSRVTHVVEKLVSLDYNTQFSKDIPSVDRHKACCVPLKKSVPEVIFCWPFTTSAHLISDFPIFPTIALTDGTVYSESLVPTLTKTKQNWTRGSSTILHSIPLHPDDRPWNCALTFKWQKVDFWLKMPVFPLGELARLGTKQLSF